MIKKFLAKGAVSAAAVALVAAANPAQAAIINLSNGVTLTTGGTLGLKLLVADNVKVGTKTYSVTFGDTPEIATAAFANPTSDPAGAAAAATVLLNDVLVNAGGLYLFDSLPGLTNGCSSILSLGNCSVYVPYSFDLTAQTFDGAFAINRVGADGTGTITNLGLGSIASSSSRTFANFTLLPDPSSAVPEPSTWALMMAGFGIAGFALRRSKASERRVAFAG